MIKERKFLKHPKEEFKELGRFTKNIFNKEYYKAIPGYFKTNKPENKLILSTTGSAAFSCISWGMFWEVVLNNSLFGLTYAGMGLAALTVPTIFKPNIDLYRLFSTKKEDLETIVNITKNSDETNNLTKIMGLLSYNDFSKIEKKELEDIAKSSHPTLENYLENIPKLNEIKNKKVRKFAFQDFLVRPHSFEPDQFKIIEKCENEQSQELALLTKNKNPYGTSFEYFLEKKINPEFIETYKNAIENDWTHSTEFHILEKCLEKFDQEFIELTKYAIKRRIDYSAIRKIEYNYEKFTANEKNRKLTKSIMRKSSRNFIDDQITFLKYLVNDENNGQEIINKIANLGRKKIERIIRKTSPLITLYGEGSVEYIKEFLENNEIENLPQLFNSIEDRIKEYFNIESIDTTLTKDEIGYLIKGYNKNREDENSYRFVSSVLEGKTLHEYYDEDTNVTSTEISFFPVWDNGYFNEIESTIELSIDSKKIAKENYLEAIEHLNDFGLEIEITTNYQKHTEELLDKIEGLEGKLIEDAREHLELLKQIRFGQKIESSSLTYRTGDLKDWAFIGEYRRQTCLSLTRMNSVCTLSMAGQENTIPFIVSTEINEKEVIIKRAILRYNEKYLIIDDIYGEEINFLPEVHKFANELELKLVVPEKMKDSLSKEDQKFLTQNTNKKEKVIEKVNAMIYSDSGRGRKKNQEFEYEAYVINS
ncbi:hypothetical protein HON71_02070 [Candidatus Woesearchaeota archaeon]|nr:hypothetical protein [Candidatus Woesearchaeota archaeon]